MNLSEIGIEQPEKSLQALFNIENEKIKANIKDERTKMSDKRKIKIELTYEPEDRRFVNISYSIKTELAQIQGGTIQVEIPDNGNARPAIVSNRIDGQIDYRDLPHDEDGVIIEDE